MVVILALMIPLLAVVLDSHLGRALAEYIARRGGPALDGNIPQQRLAALESEVERLSAEVLRLEEETEFLHKLLASEPRPKGDLPPGSPTP